jgi:hypothetical protein
VAKRSVNANTVLTGALATGAALATPYPASNNLGDQLKMVARMIAAAPALGAKRQVFFVSLGGFDLHDKMATAHPVLMKTVADAMAAFYASTVELGVADNVTTFTASDFGRTMTGNNDGADHGWGSMHFVLGGAVKGQRLYGTAPIVANGGPDDVGRPAGGHAGQMDGDVGQRAVVGIAQPVELGCVEAHPRFLINCLLGERRDALPDDAPAARRTINSANQDPAGADFFDGDRGAEFFGDFIGPAEGRALAFEHFIAVVDDGGVEDGLGKDGHSRLSSVG